MISDINELQKIYLLKKNSIKNRLEEFKNISSEDYIYEMIFCLLTPASNAKRCWEAVEIIKEKKPKKDEIREILRKHTRFHNNKTERVYFIMQNWKKINNILKDKNIIQLRNNLAENINGYGLKEASHFLRNIGKSNNQIAILDRHILNNLNNLKIIEDNKIKSRNKYLEIERKFIEFSEKMKIPIDEIDLLFWSHETGEIFK